jgi:hypothetical protein
MGLFPWLTFGDSSLPSEQGLQKLFVFLKAGVESILHQTKQTRWPEALLHY